MPYPPGHDAVKTGSSSAGTTPVAIASCLPTLTECMCVSSGGCCEGAGNATVVGSGATILPRLRSVAFVPTGPAVVGAFTGAITSPSTVSLPANETVTGSPSGTPGAGFMSSHAVVGSITVTAVGRTSGRPYVEWRAELPAPEI